MDAGRLVQTAGASPAGVFTSDLSVSEYVLLGEAGNARELAMARMRAEADHLAADGIVGVNLRMQMYAWGQSCLEFVATGTAVRRLADEHKLPDTTPKPTFTLGLDQ